ncbi:MAG: DUF1311 domain-containing protein [Neisseriaceae bacterium]|nr:DUF1311 domain-containing protein [Neisseriaceae bacterium]
MLKKTLLAVSAVIACQVSLGDPCSRYNTSYDRTYCLSKLFVESDNELNEVYKELRQKIDGGTREKLKQTQLSWIKYRNNRCETQPGTINVDCNYEVNRVRTEYLRDRLRECKTGACDKNAIVRPSW